MSDVTASKVGRVLVVDDDEDVLSAAKLMLKRHVAQVDTEKNPNALPTLLKNQPYDVILLDMNFTKDLSSGREGFVWLEKILEIDPAAVVILITAYGDVEMAVRAIKQGATDFVVKPWNNEKLLATVYAALKLRNAQVQLVHTRERERLLAEDLDSLFQDIIGRSVAMRRVFETVLRVAATDANVLILGENGTGKELVARAVHRHSPRKDGPFVGVDLGAVSETLFESELFGHMRGSFTDAKEDRLGRFEVAQGGSLFLDEIGNLSMALQAKLLTALQSRQVTRIGSNKAKEVDIRLICATNKNPYEMVEAGDFRQDLLYRINTIEIKLPPLRDRSEDIPLLAHHYLELFVRKYKKPIRSISQPALNKLSQYQWPGNIRELQHTLERAVIMSDASVLQPEDLLLTPPEARGGKAKGGDNVALDTYNLEELEKLMIRKVLAKHNGNISNAAKELGLTRASLYRRLEKHDL